MKNEFIPYEQALILKELGFDEPCFGYYYASDKKEVKLEMYIDVRNQDVYYVSSPLYRQAFRWLIYTFQLYSTINIDRTTYPKFSYNITEFIGNPINLSEKEWGWKILFSDGLYKTYEEAEIECVKKLIEIAKERIL